MLGLYVAHHWAHDNEPHYLNIIVFHKQLTTHNRHIQVKKVAKAHQQMLSTDLKPGPGSLCKISQSKVDLCPRKGPFPGRYTIMIREMAFTCLNNTFQGFWIKYWQEADLTSAHANGGPSSQVPLPLPAYTAQPACHGYAHAEAVIFHEKSDAMEGENVLLPKDPRGIGTGTRVWLTSIFQVSINKYIFIGR